MSWIFIRHGMSPGNERGAYIGSTDEPLSADGRKALKHAAKNGQYADVEKVYVSPMLRCMQTAAIIYPHMDAVAVDDFRERDFGKYEGKTFEELKSDEAYMRWVNSNGTIPFPEGETDEGFRRRVLLAFDRIWDKDRDKKVAVIAHGGTIMTILHERFAKGDEPMYSYRLDNGGCYEVSGDRVREADDGGIRDREVVEKGGMLQQFIRSGRRMLRLGYTTGACAALAAKAATELLLTGRVPDGVSVMSARGIEVRVPVARWGITEGEDVGLAGKERPAEDFPGGQEHSTAADGDDTRTGRAVLGAWCSVIKDAGDDPDVTDGIEIVAAVRKTGLPRVAGRMPDTMSQNQESDGGKDAAFVTIDGGKGVGRVTKPGLDRPVGEAAINSAPRQMITEAVRGVCEKEGYAGGIEVVISVPSGEEVAKKTFNPAIGIVGGISILGTTGIEYPMSEDAIIRSIEVELHQARQLSESVILTPGNYGEKCIEKYGLNPEGLPVVRFSGYLGETLDICVTEKFKNVLLVSHIGKLVKTAGGIMNTHQRTADCRMELFTAHAAICGADTATCRRLMEQTTTDGCIAVLDGADLQEEPKRQDDAAQQGSTRQRDAAGQGSGLRAAVIGSLMEAIKAYLHRRVEGELNISAVMFSNKYGILARTDTGQGE